MPKIIFEPKHIESAVQELVDTFIEKAEEVFELTTEGSETQPVWTEITDSLKKNIKNYFNIVKIVNSVDVNQDKPEYTPKEIKPEKQKPVEWSHPVKGRISRPRNGFMYYIDSRRSTLMEQHPEKSIAEISKLIGREWIEMTNEAKAPYMKMARDDRERYEREVEDFKTQRNANLQSGVHKSQYMSNSLCDFIGLDHGSTLPRTEVIKNLCAYAKKHCAKDPNDSRKFIPTTSMASLLGLNDGESIGYIRDLQLCIKRQNLLSKTPFVDSKSSTASSASVSEDESLTKQEDVSHPQDTNFNVSPPRRPFTVFFRYKRDNMPRVIEANPTLRAPQISVMIDNGWYRFKKTAESNPDSQEAKQLASYQAQYEKDNAEYKKLQAEWEAKIQSS